MNSIIPLNEKNVFTTGDLAKICSVAPKTTANWIDSGILLGYVLPGSKDRRVDRQELVSFLKKHGMTGALAVIQPPKQGGD